MTKSRNSGPRCDYLQGFFNWEKEHCKITNLHEKFGAPGFVFDRLKVISNGKIKFNQRKVRPLRARKKPTVTPLTLLPERLDVARRAALELR